MEGGGGQPVQHSPLVMLAKQHHFHFGKRLVCFRLPTRPLTSTTSPLLSVAQPAKLTPEGRAGPGVHVSSSGSYVSELRRERQLPSWPPVQQRSRSRG